MKWISIILIVLTLAHSCKKTENTVPVIEIPMGTLELIESYKVDVPEPSGLSFGPGKASLLTVSDHTNQVYELDMQGNVTRTYDYTGKDLEGVTYNPDKNLIAIAEEADREVTLLDYSSGNVEGTYEIDIQIGAENSGLEGISYNMNNKLYYIVNETNPDLMVLWRPESGKISEEKLGFAADYSGVFADVDHSNLWFVSDQSQSLYKCDYSANVLLKFSLDKLKYEGVVINNDLVYLINDATAELNIYQIKK
jgi:uncharacterized protein YjiK